MQLEWGEHARELVSSIGDLLADECLLDVTLAADGRRIKAHKLILAAASQYFKDMITSSPDSCPIIYLRDVSFIELKSLVDFIYCGKTDVPTVNLSAFLALANSLGIKGFTEGQKHAVHDQENKPRTPTKRRIMAIEDQENVSPKKCSLSEPVDLNQEGKKKEKKRRSLGRSLDDVAAGPLATVDLNKTVPKSTKVDYQKETPTKLQDDKSRTKEDDDSLFKKPLPPKPTKSIPPSSLGPPLQSSSSSLPCSASNTLPSQQVHPARPSVGNMSFDSSTISSLDPNELAAKGATLLQQLAIWMLEEKRLQETGTGLPTNDPPNPTISTPNTLGPGNSKTAARSSGTLRLSECDRPDSGFEGEPEANANAAQAEAVAQIGVCSSPSGSSSSPEAGEISRQAIIRQPIFRKKRLHPN